MGSTVLSAVSGRLAGKTDGALVISMTSALTAYAQVRAYTQVVSFPL
jgi:hypothetical protein